LPLLCKDLSMQTGSLPCDFVREFGCFSSIPDVQVIKTKSAALASLKSIKAEMQSRFDFLEKEKLTKLDPVQHNYPRIFVAIDEASELLALPDRLNPDKETIAEARRIINDIAKLGRAAAINLLIATQKVSKSIIDTALQENIGGRMAFRMATLANSTQVLGAKEASDLPEIPGRAIWNFGTKFLEVQVPYINEEELKIKVKQISQLRALSKGSSASGDEVSEAKRFSSKPSQSVVEELTE
jgi:S-DNA-T family DNA segregation ATPase FtsK/SpoIIIE